MSWAEVKKINSDLSTPINIANLINHIDLVGSVYVGNDLSLNIELLKSDSIYSHQIALSVVSNRFWTYVTSLEIGAGELLADTFSINSSSLRSKDTLSDINLDSVSMSDLFNSKKASISCLHGLDYSNPIFDNPIFQGKSLSWSANLDGTDFSDVNALCSSYADIDAVIKHEHTRKRIFGSKEIMTNLCEYANTATSIKNYIPAIYDFVDYPESLYGMAKAVSDDGRIALHNTLCNIEYIAKMRLSLFGADSIFTITKDHEGTNKAHDYRPAGEKSLIILNRYYNSGTVRSLTLNNSIYSKSWSSDSSFDINDTMFFNHSTYGIKQTVGASYTDRYPKAYSDIYVCK